MSDDLVRLELLVGDPLQAGNQLGYASVLAADENRESLTGQLHATVGNEFAAELVPSALGGRFDTVPGAGAALRVLARRDLSLVVEQLGGLLASLRAWSADAAEQKVVTDLLLNNGQICPAFRARVGSSPDRAWPDAEFLVTDPRHADAVSLWSAGSQLLLEPDHQALSWSPPHRGIGLRGCRFHTVRLDVLRLAECEPLGVRSQKADPGSVGRLAGTVLNSASLGAVDAALRAVFRFAAERQLYGQPVTELPSARALLADVFVDLLIADCCVLVAGRWMHTRPAEASVQAMLHGLVLELINNSMHQLATLLGARSYLREGPYAIFQKHRRDLTAVASLWRSLAWIDLLAAPRLHDGEPAPEEVFGIAPDLPALGFADAACSSTDSLSIDLARLHDTLARARVAPELVELINDLLVQSALLNKRDLSARTATEHRARLLGAVACLQLWWQGRPGATDFLGRTAWIIAALRRLTGRSAAPSTDSTLFDELTSRLRNNVSFDLAQHTLA